MRVAFVMPGVGVEGRGAEAFVLDLAASLAATGGFVVDLFSRGPAPEGLGWQRVHALARDRPWLARAYRRTRLGKKLLDTLFLDPLNLEWATASLSAFPRLLARRYDVVVMEGGLVGARLCRLLRLLRGTPFVDIAHGADPKWEGAFARQRPDRAVVFTEAAAARLRRLAPRTRVEVIPHGVDLDLFRPRTDPPPVALAPPVVVAAGAVDDHKRLDLTVEALARLGRGSLLLLGDGPADAAVDALARRLLGAGRYHRRRVARSELPRWLAGGELFTLPSVTESFGLVYLEAMACGLPVVAPDDAIRREVVGDAGLFCRVEDPAVYAETLARALDRDWGDLPRRRAERFPFAATAAAYARLLEEVAR